MYCPECGAEFKEGITRCYDCEVELVAEPPSEPEVEPYATVLETSEVSAIPVIKTALEAAGIPYRTRGEGLLRLFPSEALGAPFHDSAGEVLIRVPKSRAEEAREILETAATMDEDDAAAEEASESA